MTPRVLMQIRWDAATRPGGDAVQLTRTMERLDELQLARVSRSSETHVDLREFDLVHVFNLTRLHETFVFARNAVRQGVPYVVSSIWHSFEDLEAFHASRRGSGAWVRRIGMPGYLMAKDVYYGIRTQRLPPTELVMSWQRCLRWTLRNAAFVLPNSRSELQALRTDSGVNDIRAIIVPNATDATPADLRLAVRPKVVMCVGRIEPLKNQLALMDAFDVRPSLRDYRLVFVGSKNQSHRTYGRTFEARLKPGRFEWLPHLPHPSLMAALEGCRVLVLPSFFETTGLVGLEALSRGANVVMTNRGYTQDYYSDLVEYCDPYDVHSIADALERALSRATCIPHDHLEAYTWDVAARETALAYRAALGWENS